MVSEYVSKDLKDLSTTLYGGFSDLQLNTVRESFANQNVSLDAGSFTDYTTQMYAGYASNQAINHAKMLVYQSAATIDPNKISVISREGLYNANPVMQRFVMSHPDLYSMYEDQEIDGYAGTYINPEKTNIIDNTNYRNIVSGVSGTVDHLQGGSFFSGSNEGVLISAMDRMSIIDTWGNVNNALALGDDPTSKN